MAGKVDPKVIQAIAHTIGLAEMFLGSDIIPGLKGFFVKEYKLPAAQAAELERGYDQLLAVQRKSRARRAEIGAAAGVEG